MVRKIPLVRSRCDINKLTLLDWELPEALPGGSDDLRGKWKNIILACIPFEERSGWV
jgi:hypothetical protein